MRNYADLYNCQAEDIKVDGDNLIVTYPDGLLLTPVSNHTNSFPLSS